MYVCMYACTYACICANWSNVREWYREGTFFLALANLFPDNFFVLRCFAISFTTLYTQYLPWYIPTYYFMTYSTKFIKFSISIKLISYTTMRAWLVQLFKIETLDNFFFYTFLFLIFILFLYKQIYLQNYLLLRISFKVFKLRNNWIERFDILSQRFTAITLI